MVKRTKVLPTSICILKRRANHGKPHGHCLDLIIGGPLVFAPLTLDQVLQGGVIKIAE
jgi:hypothetical protein